MSFCSFTSPSIAIFIKKIFLKSDIYDDFLKKIQIALRLKERKEFFTPNDTKLTDKLLIPLVITQNHSNESLYLVSNHPNTHEKYICNTNKTMKKDKQSLSIIK